MEESSLTDFLADDGEREESTRDGADAADQASSGQDEDAMAEPAPDETNAAEASVEPATVTAAWDPTGAECSACGESARWRWREADRVVCEDCKSW